MNKREFMSQLERLLWEIPEQERLDALEYYNDYFEEAGEEQEAMVIQDLGSPGKVAAMIKANLKNTEDNYGEFTEAGYQDPRFTGESQVPDKINVLKKWEEKKSSFRNGSGRTPRNFILIIIIIIVTSPLWFGAIGTIFGVGFGLLGALVGIVAGLAGGSLGLIFGGLTAVIVGLIKIISNPGVGLASAGCGFLLTSLGLLLLVAFVWAVSRVIPKIFRGIAGLLSRILHRGRRGGDQ